MIKKEWNLACEIRYKSRHGCDEELIRELFNQIAEDLAEGHSVQIRGFGTFKPEKRAPRTGRNPHTGEAVPIPERIAPVFKPSEVLKRRVGGTEWKN